MALPTLAGFATYALVFYFLDKIIDDAAGDPEGKLADVLAKQEHISRMGYMAPVHRAAMREEIAPRYRMPVGEEATEAALVRRGMMDIELMGGRSRELLSNVAARMGMDPKTLADQMNPMRVGDYSEISRAAFGRRPKRLVSPQQGG